MSKQTEALKLALEALEWMEDNEGLSFETEITAIKKALAEQDDPDLQDKDPELVEQHYKQVVDGVRAAFDAKRKQPAQQEPHCYMDEYGNVHGEYEDWMKTEGGWFPVYTSPPAQQHDCSRSHPHENMDAMCKLRTEIARLTNENARLKARHQDDEINTYRMTLLCIRDGLQQGMSKYIQKLQAREINDVLGLPSFASYRTSPPASKPLTDEEIDQLLPEIVSGGTFTVITYGRAVARAIEAAHGIKGNE